MVAYAILSILFIIIALGLTIVTIVGAWKLFEKAGKPGWACIVPVYNYIVWIEIAQKPMWWIAMLFVPIASIVFIFMIMMAVAKNFGKSEGYGVGMVLLGFIFIPMLGFSKAEYIPRSEQLDSLV